MDWLESVRTYVRVVEQGSFHSAASSLNITTSALSKRINWLENQLNIQLMRRTTRSLSLTEAGENFYQKARYQLIEWQSLIDETRTIDSSPYGKLIIGATVAVGAKILMPYLDCFLAKYPNMKVKLITTSPGQIPELQLDVFISRKVEQINTLSHKALPLSNDQQRFYASPVYLEKYGTPTNIDDLKQHNLLVWGEHEEKRLTLSNGQTLVMDGNFSTSNPETLFESVKRGMGIVLTPENLAKESAEKGEIIPILPDIHGEGLSLYAYYPYLQQTHTRTQLFIDFLKQNFVARQEDK